MGKYDHWLSAGPLITDGAWGTQLQARGLQPGTIPDTWNLTQPAHVESVASAYVQAGSQVVLTNTFRANAITLGEAGFADQVDAINRAGVELSRKGAAGRALVFASIGPTGKMLMMGEVTPEAASAAFLQQARALADAGADALLIETMSEVDEARLAVQAALTTGLPVIASFAFDTGKNKDRTMMGATPEQVAQELTAAGADVIGANCGVGIERYVPVCQRLRAATDRPIWIKANAGLPAMIEGKVVYQSTPAQFASHVPALLQAGASFIGGCCGTNPEFIRALKRLAA